MNLVRKILFTGLVMAVVAGTAFANGQQGGGSSGGVTRGMDRKIVMGYSQIGAESEWRTACTNSVKAAAAEWNIDLRFSDAQQQQQNQLQAIRTFIQQKVDIIAFTPVVETGWEAILKECLDAGIPTICVDRSIEGSDRITANPNDRNDPDNWFTAFIGSDMEQEGNRAANWLIANVPNLKPGKSVYNIVELQGTVGSSAMTGRFKGFRDSFGIPAASSLGTSADGKYRIILSQTGDFTRAQGKQVMEAFMKSNGNDIDILFAHNDDMAIGAIQAIQEAGKVPGKDIIIIGIDAVKGAFEAMVAGTMNASIECNPLLGPQVMETAVNILNKKPVEKWVVSKESDYDQSNAAAAYPSRQY
ncbi:LacI family transcriptional regulator [Spirochaetia bacterium]|nr:LacI family transcriptional regulator [Spirochaetia bacterium]GHU34620.1 LacI family transcriptional regulator [Spirochaetia bacterium]